MVKRKFNVNKRNANRNYRKRIFVCGEGETEYEYFDFLRKLSDKEAVIELVRSSNSSPNQVLKSIQKNVPVSMLGDRDEVWLVIDRNGRKEKEFRRLKEWLRESNRYGIAISNPKFEYWLLLHFDDGEKISSGKDCDKRLAMKMNLSSIRKIKNPDLNTLRKFTKDNVSEAIVRAKKRIKISENKNWPIENGTTLVHLLVEKII